MSRKTIFVTGAAGFIGSHICRRLLLQKHKLAGVDYLSSDDPDLDLKKARLAQIPVTEKFHFQSINIQNKARLEEFYQQIKPDIVIHLAARAGVRESILAPEQYVQDNIVAFGHILEIFRAHFQQTKKGHLLAASSSSVYGGSENRASSETDDSDHPQSLYAATKKANEVMAYSYSSLYGLPITMLRFFTTYGPWGRPSMAMLKFIHAIIHGQTIELYNHGRMERDFVYIDDLVAALLRLLDRIFAQDETIAPIPPAVLYQIYNIGSSHNVQITQIVDKIAQITGRKAIVASLPMQPGDVRRSCADGHKLSNLIGDLPITPLEKGLLCTYKWYCEYHNIPSAR